MSTIKNAFTRDEIIATLAEQAQEIAWRLDRRAGVIDGTPFVVECCDSMYLMGADENGRCRARGITSTGVMCYDRKSAESRAADARATGGVWANARVVHINDALKAEHDKLINLIKTISAA